MGGLQVCGCVMGLLPDGRGKVCGCVMLLLPDGRVTGMWLCDGVVT